jgi:hypothetical protein
VLLSVTTFVGLVTPTGKLPKSRLVDDNETMGPVTA